jgi:hypothetical protein
MLEYLVSTGNQGATGGSSFNGPKLCTGCCLCIRSLVILCIGLGYWFSRTLLTLLRGDNIAGTQYQANNQAANIAVKLSAKALIESGDPQSCIASHHLSKTIPSDSEQEIFTLSLVELPNDRDFPHTSRLLRNRKSDISLAYRTTSVQPGKSRIYHAYPRDYEFQHCVRDFGRFHHYLWTCLVSLEREVLPL